MAIVSAVKCDRCPRVAESPTPGFLPEGWSTIVIDVSNGMTRSKEKDRYDLCPACTGQVHSYVLEAPTQALELERVEPKQLSEGEREDGETGPEQP